MAEDLTLVEINTQGLDSDLNFNFSALEDAVNLKSDDSTVVHLAGTETITGDKTFSGITTIGSSSGLLKAASGVVSTAVEGTDYLAPDGDGSALKGLTQSQISGLKTTDSPTFSGLTTAGQVFISSPDYPPILVERTTSTVTDLPQATLRVIAHTSGDMEDGFAAQLNFGIEDSAGILNSIGSVGVKRSGADNNGTVYFSAYNAGTAIER